MKSQNSHLLTLALIPGRFLKQIVHRGSLSAAGSFTEGPDLPRLLWKTAKRISVHAGSRRLVHFEASIRHQQM